jgi:nucleotide-binding universal stress UspA family protein
MSEKNPGPVVVAVGHDPMDAALAYAAGEATRAGCELHLVHVVHAVALGPETAVMESVDLDITGKLALEGALERARDLVPATVPVTSELVRGGVATSIAHAGEKARLIVLQRRPLSRMMRVVTRSVSSGVAARSRVSVVSVPAGWTPIRSGDAVPTVTVGVDAPERSEHLLRVAARAATRRGASLRVLHTWAFPGAYDDIVISRLEDGEWAARATAEIQSTLDRMGDDLGGVTATIDVLHGPPGDALIDAGRTSDLLVVGRHDPLIPFGSHLGPVARAVLREATCPVLLAAPSATRHRPWRHDHGATAQVSPEDS